MMKTSIKCGTLILTMLVSGCAQSSAEAMECPMNMTFSSEQDVANWRAVNDGVMGGRSSGGPQFEDGHMVFSGVINTNGGGFSSIRALIRVGALGDMSALKLRIKSDGRAYKVTLRTNARMGWRNVSFEAKIPALQADKWAEVTVPFSDLRPTVFGRPVRGAPFDPAAVESIGIILADGQDGPFRLDVELVEACKSPDVQKL
jgi:hypothetical protein